MQTEHVRDNDQLDGLLNEIVEAKIKQKELEAAQKVAKDDADEAAAEYEEWKKNYPYCTNVALMEHGKHILRPVGNVTTPSLFMKVVIVIQCEKCPKQYKSSTPSF